MNSKDAANNVENVRKLIGAALCDFVAVLGGTKDPFIVGGQYPKERLVTEFRAWLQDRNFNVAGATDVSKKWLNLCDSHSFCGREGEPRTPIEKPPTPKAKKPPPKPKAKPPAGMDDEEKGFLNGDDWKPKEDRKDNWQDEGEDWKKGEKDDE
jgi:hypothetical protein